MRQELLAEIKFRGIVSNVLLIGGSMSIWALCKFCGRVSLAGFLTAVFFICLVFLASMVFRLLAARQISKLSASKLFTRISSALIAAALIAILWLSMALYSVSQVGFSVVEYAAAQNSTPYIYSGLAFMCTALQFIDIPSLNGLVSPYTLLTIAL